MISRRMLLMFLLTGTLAAQENNLSTTSQSDTLEKVSSDAHRLVASELPIFIIDTDGDTIPDDPKIPGTLKVIDNPGGTINRVIDPPTDYFGNIGIEIRGNSSASYPQTPYAIETRDVDGGNLNISLLGMPAEDDWALISNYNDRVMMRNVLSYYLFQRMGHYAPRARFVDVIIDDDYKGIYIFTEKIKINHGRVNIAKTGQSRSGDSLTGGYIFKVDYPELNNGWVSNYSPIGPDWEVNFLYHDPKAYEMNASQKNYLQDWVDHFESVLYSSDFDDSASGYRAYVDIPSFIDYFILQEVTRNPDGYKKSKFYYKQRDSDGGKLVSGPAWDYDWSYKNLNGLQSDGSGWSYVAGSWMYPTPTGWIMRMKQDTLFERQAANRYWSLRRSFLHTDSVFAFIDQQYSLIAHAKDKHFSRWPILDVYDPRNMDETDLPSTYEGHMERFKNWIAIRLNWLDDNMPEEIPLSPAYDPFRVNSLVERAQVSVKLYPNPTVDKVFVDAPKPIYTVELYNTCGQQLQLVQVNGSYSAQLHVQDRQPGLYLLKVQFTDQSFAIERLVVQ